MRAEMKIVKTFRGHEGVGFNADLYVAGVKVAFVIVQANGGCFYYETGKGYSKEKFQELQKFIKTLPDKVFAKQDGLDAFSCKMDIDLYISDLLIIYEEKHAKTQTIVENLRQISDDIKRSKIEFITIPMTASFNEKYPMGIKPGDYTKEELAEAIQFLADMLE